MAPRCLQPAMLTLFHGGNNNSKNNKNNNNNNNNLDNNNNRNRNRNINRRRRSFGVGARLPIVTVFAALVLASAGWIGGQDLFSNSGGTSGSGKNNNNKKIDGWKQDAGSEYRGSHELVGSSACGLCFHALPQRPAWASKARARPSLVGTGLPAWHSASSQPPLSASVQRFAQDNLKRLTSELSSATSAQAVLNVLEQEEMSKLNEFHIGAAFTRLARNKRDFTSAVRESPVWRKLTVRLLEMIDTEDGLPARECANVFWSIASLQSETPELQELLPRLIENAKFTAPDMDPQAFCNIVWSCAKSRLSSSQLHDLLPPILERLADRADFLTAQDIANCIWSSAKLKADAPEILEVMPVLMEMAEKKALNFNAQELSNIIWSMATLREEMPELQELLPALLKALPKRAMARAIADGPGHRHRDRSPEAHDVANVVWSLGVLKAGDLAGHDVLCYLANRGTPIIKKFIPQGLANAAWGFALCGFKDAQFMSAAAAQAVASVPSWSKKDLSMALPVITWAFAKLNMSNSALLASTAKHLPPVRRSASDWTICALAWSYDKLDPQRDFADFQDKLAKELKRRKLSPQDVERSQLGQHAWQKRPERRQ
ncbi:unnamed protein product [Polarella glacialis]|uniref:Uncharacterized protein n=1 Tax=Polarella glacialis TaxID=89957 RepID=A0A813IW73_POLGL|nr:unnamed protein product [Polarella glacialis]